MDFKHGGRLALRHFREILLSLCQPAFHISGFVLARTILCTPGNLYGLEGHHRSDIACEGLNNRNVKQGVTIGRGESRERDRRYLSSSTSSGHDFCGL